MEKRIKNIALYPILKPEIKDKVKFIAQLLIQSGIKVGVLYEHAKFFGFNFPAVKEAKILKTADVVLSLGGDGTFLRAARFVCGFDINVLGINLGGKGFLTEASFDEAEDYLDLLIKGKYSVEKKIMLDCRVARGGKKVFSATALNDVVMGKGAFERLLKIKTHINDNYAASFRADGLIVSTPTGSTAYSISAGGPIISPGASCFAVTAICPHTLSARPLVISEADTVTIIEENAPKVDIIIDGQIKFNGLKNDKIIINKSRKITKVIKIKKDFYQIVREKLKWVE